MSEQESELETGLAREIGQNVRRLLEGRVAGGINGSALGLDDPVVEAIAEHGFFATSFDEESGGLGRHDLRVGVVIREECARIGAVGLGLALGEFNDVALPVIGRRLSDQQRQRHSERLAAAAAVVAVAGLDGSIRAGATAEGWRLEGTARAVVNAPLAEFLLVLARSDSGELCFLLPVDTPGIERRARLDLIGAASLAVCEVVFRSAAAGRAALLGDVTTAEADATAMLASQEVLLAAGALADARYALRAAAEYARSRTAFGVPIADFQNTRLVLGDAEAQVAVAERQVDACLELIGAGGTNLAATAIARLRAADALALAVDTALQVHGGYGYMAEYPIAAAFAAAPVTRLLGARSRAQLRESLGLLD